MIELYDYETDEDFKLNPGQIRSAAEWFYNRVDDFAGGTVDSIYFGPKDIEIKSSWDDHCRGCYMGKIEESYTIPNDIFFSEQNLYEWKKEEDNRRKIAAKKEDDAKKRKELKAIRREEKAEYNRLKKKYEGDE